MPAPSRSRNERGLSVPSRPLNERARSYMEFVPKRAMTSFDNLVALANHQERLREARKVIWRDRGEPIAHIEDIYESFEHAGRGGLRAGALAFCIRAGVNLVLVLFRSRTIPRRLRFAILRHAVFGPDSFRFAAMLGSFVYLYKFLFNSLPIMFPPSQESSSESAVDEDDDLASASDTRARSANIDVDIISPYNNATYRERRTQRLSLSANAMREYGMIRKRTRRWHSVVAGAIAGGLAVLFEKRNRRLTIAQQLFVRGLQAEYSAWAPRFGVKVPYGSVLVFSLCCGQIMYGWLMRPDTLPKSYQNWIQQASRVSPEAININHTIVRERRFDLDVMKKVIDRSDITPSNRTSLIAKLQAASSPMNPVFGPPYCPCEVVHPWIDSCLLEQLNRWFSVFRWILPIYTALHFIPMLLFKRNVVFKRPIPMLLRAALGSARSSAFLGTFVLIYQTMLCSKANLHKLFSQETSIGLPWKNTPRWVLDAITHRSTYWIGGFLCGLSLFVEESRRRSELAMYVLPKAMESAWLMARKRGLIFKTGQYGEALLTAIGMGMVMVRPLSHRSVLYVQTLPSRVSIRLVTSSFASFAVCDDLVQNDPQHLSGLVRRILYQFVGPN
ncbi:hypothetical protein PUNSTDRAFT_100954 [Punctularia strigosozonata HHB-11173 SS5]|uniref:uncharacterized protein n=1 Tax=Punctularia strigosozonata (strain HHB-11173) TaxID=741275 RepID=UPI0004417F46|nr:uncharacterized protein PUNSTDRAFT_100954 [Punctularia strigosozonata HHB-11173 SS5]EIN11011.1 hypothetical protein PUNSTDRAFT_100954 [Punctularia strigosozonata HHB-11173 SS5]